MRVTDATLLGLIGLAAAGVLVATASGLFADPPPAVPAVARQLSAPEPAAPRLVEPPPVMEAPPPAVTPPSPVRAPASAQEQGEWRFPPQVDVKAALPADPAANVQQPAPVYAPGEQQAAWAGRDKLANAARARNPSPLSPVLTRLHEGPAPGKSGVER